MVRGEEIVDRESLRDWLEGQNDEERRKLAVALATRAALRVFPIWCEALSSKWLIENSISGLEIGRSILIAGVGSRILNPQMKEAARRASKVAATARTIAADKDSAVAASARAAVRATAAVSGDAVGYAVANSGYWGEVLEDARGIQKGKDIMCLPLWSDDIPIELVNGWRRGKSNLEDHESNAFWISWYEAILAGRPPDQRLA